jgi:hypothetical protein
VTNDAEATPLEHAIAADAESWHQRCDRMGALYAQSVGQTVLDALVKYRRLIESAGEHL